MKKPLPQLKTAMTPFPHAIDIEQDVAAARALLAAHDFHHLPVTEGGRLVGMLSTGRLATADGLSLRALCADAPLVVDIQMRLAEVLTLMAESCVDAAIVTRHAKLAGVFTASDAFRALAELLNTLDPPPETDQVA